MDTTTFSISEAFKIGWDKMKVSLWYFIGLMVGGFATIVILNFFAVADNTIVSILGNALIVLVEIIFGIALIKLTVMTLDGVRPDFTLVKTNVQTFLRYAFGSLSYSVIVIIGLVLLIIPGIFIAVRLQFYQYLIIDKKMGIIEALKESWAMTRNSWWRLFGLSLLVALINIAGALLIGVGLLITLPITMLAYGSVYRKLVNRELPMAVSNSSVN